jgi:hypothetical protein
MSIRYNSHHHNIPIYSPTNAQRQPLKHEPVIGLLFISIVGVVSRWFHGASVRLPVAWAAVRAGTHGCNVPRHHHLLLSHPECRSEFLSVRIARISAAHSQSEPPGASAALRVETQPHAHHVRPFSRRIAD